METKGAFVLRENTGTLGIELTLRTAVALLADHGIPHLVAGGLAVQEYGYFRVTLAADIIVPDMLEAVEFLTADLSGPFQRYRGAEDTIEDKRIGVLINFLPAGRAFRKACKVPFPEPTQVSETPRFVSLGQLVSLKLDSWFNNQTRRLKDKADVVELIKTKQLPRDLAVADAVRHLYTETWDALQAEQ
ncbi:MAG TPA: hypothetical protein VK968_10010 [Roseimicrobium sp.]|nr:hypothetical protein [Roseimicrobium sp.]